MEKIHELATELLEEGDEASEPDIAEKPSETTPEGLISQKK